jgi:hypothetical protein
MQLRSLYALSGQTSIAKCTQYGSNVNTLDAEDQGKSDRGRGFCKDEGYLQQVSVG